MAHSAAVRPVYTLPQNHAGVGSGFGKPQYLAKPYADSVISQVNTARGRLHGINARPLPPGQVALHRDGGFTLEDQKGRNYRMRADGTIASFSQHGNRADFRPDGRVRTLHHDGFDINRGLNGSRRIVTVRADRSILVSTSPRHGYLQRSVLRNNRLYVQRTYLVNNEIRTHYYSSYTYRGVVVEHYVPRTYYPLGFYAWAGDPWVRPVSYSWGWRRDPWFEYYGGYYTPLEVYPSPALWLADFVVAESLRAAYLSRVEYETEPEGLYAAANTPVSPELRREIAQQVQFQLAQERDASLHPGQEASYGEVPNLLRSPNKLFVVAGNLSVDSSGQECTLSPGDVLRYQSDLREGAQLQVVSSKSMECPVRSSVTVSINDLQEMHNQMRVQMEAGMSALHASQGADGIPPAPVEAMSASRVSPLADAEPADTNVKDLLKSQQAAADQAEKQVMEAVFDLENAPNI
jgi:hypothetical protein